MSKIKGKYVATVIIELEVDEGMKGLLPYEKIKENFKSLTPILKKILDDELGDEELGTIDVIQQFSDMWRCEDGENKL